METEDPLLNNGNLIQYLATVEAFDPSPVQAHPIEQTQYCGHLYLNGSESFEQQVRQLESVAHSVVEQYMNSLRGIKPLLPAQILPLRNLRARLQRLIDDDQREVKRMEFFNAGQPRFIDRSLPYNVQEVIEDERRSCQFFCECLCVQINSADRLVKSIEKRIVELNAILSHQIAVLNPLESAFEVVEQISYNDFLAITTTLHRELVEAGFWSRATGLAAFRSLFVHREQRLDATAKSELLTPHQWMNNSWRTVSYFVKQLQRWLIVAPPRGAKRSNYRIAHNRIKSPGGQPFAVRKFRHDADPNAWNQHQIDAAIGDTIREFAGILCKVVPLDLQRELRIAFDMKS